MDPRRLFSSPLKSCPRPTAPAAAATGSGAEPGARASRSEPACRATRPNHHAAAFPARPIQDPATTRSANLLTAEQLSCRHLGRRVLEAIDLDVRAKEIVAVVGPSGAGKTALLECFLGLRRPVAGRARIAGVDVARLGEHATALTAYVPAQLHFPPGTNLLEHARQVCARHGRRMPEAVLRAALQRGGITPEWHGRPCGACPAGVQRQLALALATLKNVGVFLLDDPTRDLDERRRNALVLHLRRLRKGGAALLLATRDLAFARRVASRLVLLENGAVVEMLDLMTSRQEFHARSYLADLVA